MRTIYNVEQFENFPKEVTKAFGELDDGFLIAEALEKIGYVIVEMGLDGYFEEFYKQDVDNFISLTE